MDNAKNAPPRKVMEMDRPLLGGKAPESLPEVSQIIAAANAYRDNAVMAQGMGISPINYMRGSMEQIGRLIIEIATPGHEIEVLNLLQKHLRNGMDQSVMQRRIDEANAEGAKNV